MTDTFREGSPMSEAEYAAYRQGLLDGAAMERERIACHFEDAENPDEWIFDPYVIAREIREVLGNPNSGQDFASDDQGSVS